MIVKEIRKNPDKIIKSFDYYNDYKDTRSYLEYYADAALIIEKLDTGYERYLKGQDTND